MRVSGVLRRSSAEGGAGTSWPGVGNLSIGPSVEPTNSLHLHWTYTAPGAYFAADSAFNDSACLVFTPDDGVSLVTVAVRWPVVAGTVAESGAHYDKTPSPPFSLCVVATTDCTVSLNTNGFTPGVPPLLQPPPSAEVNWTRLHVLEGQRECVSVETR